MDTKNLVESMISEWLSETLGENTRDEKKLRSMALKAAVPFGGSADPSHRKILDKLEKEGFIEILSVEPLDGFINYGLTSKGKSYVKTMKEGLDEGYRVVANDMYDNSTYTSPIRKTEADAKLFASRLKKATFKDGNPMYSDVKVVKESSNESDYKIMHKTFTDAVNTAKEKAEKSGYTIDDDEWFRNVSSGPRKPGTDKTNRYSIPLLTSKGNDAKKALHFQVYNTGNAYELNAYIN